MPNEAKRDAQEALFSAISDLAENSGKAALPAADKVRLVRELAEAYRLTAGGSMPAMPTHDGQSANDAPRKKAPAR